MLTGRTPARRPISHWERALGAPSFTALETQLHADAVIIGAGVTGLSAALAFKTRPNATVVLLEAHQPGSGATSASSGYLLPHHHRWEHVLAQQGPHAATEWNAFARRGRDSVLALTSGTRVPFAWAGTQKHAARVAQLTARLKAVSQEGRPLSKREMESQWGCTFYEAAL